MATTQTLKKFARRWIVRLGLEPLLQKYQVRRHRAEIKRGYANPEAPLTRGRRKRADATQLDPCDVARRPHVPGSSRDTYGSDKSRTVEYRFNASGYRSEDIDPDARFRVLLIGESNAFGTGVPFDETLGQRFKAHLAEAMGWSANEVNVLNLSVGGASADYCARTLLRQVDKALPDLVVVFLPTSDRLEDYTKKKGINYTVSGVDLDKLDEAPIPVQGYLDLYNLQFGRVNFVKNVLLMQLACQSRGVEFIFLSKELRERNFETPILRPLFDQVETGHVVLHGSFKLAGDRAADGSHGGARSHEVMAIKTLERFGALLQSGGDEAGAASVADYVARQKVENRHWTHRPTEANGKRTPQGTA